jgi:hypothetical protein
MRHARVDLTLPNAQLFRVVNVVNSERRQRGDIQAKRRIPGISNNVSGEMQAPDGEN